MLTMKNIKSEQAQHYFSKGYYERGRWFGKGAQNLNLAKYIENKEEFDALLEGYSPDRKKSLMARRINPDKHRAAIDCTFSAPKSISLQALIGGDDRLIDAHRKAVEEALQLMESRYAQTRIYRTGKPRQKVQTKCLAIAQFDHIETRDLDPHLHTHCVVMNFTQADDKKWRSLSNDAIYTNQKLLGMVYQHKLACTVQQLGYQTIPLGNGQFEIVGYDKKELEAFSKRRQKILSVTGKNANYKQRNKAWNITRNKKYLVQPEKLKALWKQEGKIIKLKLNVPSLTQKLAPLNTFEQYISAGIEHHSKRSLFLKIEDIERYVLERAKPVALEEVTKNIVIYPKLIKIDAKNYTTESALKLELATLKLMLEEKEKIEPLISEEELNETLSEKGLKERQQLAILRSLGGKDRFTAWRVLTNQTKWKALKAVKEIAQEKGYQVRGIARDYEADSLKTEVEMETMQLHQLDEKIISGEIGKNEIWIVTQADKLTNKEVFDLFTSSFVLKAKVIMVGQLRERNSFSNIFKSLQQVGMTINFLDEPLIERKTRLLWGLELIGKGDVPSGIEYLQSFNNRNPNSLKTLKNSEYSTQQEMAL
ncbi:MAG: conjugative relaxase [Gloeocapsa sp. DLM2.Bin57]|nr:MAG: conjugative relaxase [Gloeocapsa sp. DLM2.Bin57]